VGDIRESPALRIMHMLGERGAILSYHDRFVPTLPQLRLTSVPLQEIDGADAVVLVTAHPGVDHTALAAAAQLFVDLRGVTRGLQLENVVRL